MTARSPLALALAALLLTACALALADAAPPRAGHAAPSGLPSGPFACALHVVEGGGRVALEGRLTAREAVSGTYSLRVEGPGVSLDQGGEAVAAAGQTVVLGEARLSGRAADYAKDLAVTVDGRRVVCPVRP